jgi:hypothetical protein
MLDLSISEEIRKTLAFQNKLFDPSACPAGGFELQFVFNGDFS